MPIYKVSSSREKYRKLAIQGDLSRLSGRDKPLETKRRALLIKDNLSRLNVKKNSLVLDMGCGDGTLLRELSSRFGICVGAVPSEEEKNLLARAFCDWENILFLRGKSEEPLSELPGQTADLIVCNSVLHGNGFDASSVAKSLGAFSVMQEKGQVLYLGEIPVRNEFEGRDYGLSFRRYLVWCLKTGRLWRLTQNFFMYLHSSITENVYIIQGTSGFHSVPDDFIPLVESFGYQYVSAHDSASNDLLTAGDTKKENIDRVDYIFIKSQVT